jgi:16S rRNA (adenine1518-N6/adenine1519-N6)-dimethyltransferase
MPLWLIEIDNDLIPSLQQTFPETKILNVDFLSVDFQKIFTDQTGIIGNFPYNISSQILIKILENRQIVPEVVGMFQKEVAERLVAAPGSKEYGRLSVLVQTFYSVKILSSASDCFLPPPKVESAVIRMERKENMKPYFRQVLFFGGEGSVRAKKENA